MHDESYWQMAVEVCKHDVENFYGTGHEKTQMQIFLFLANTIIFGQMSSAKYKALKVKDLWPIAELLAGVKNENSFRNNRAQLIELSHTIGKRAN